MQSRLSSRAAEVPVPTGMQADFTVGNAQAAGALENAQPGVSGGAGLAHDAGNLIGALGLYCDLMSRPGVISPDFQHYLTELRHLAVRGESLIERLLHLDWEQFGVTVANSAPAADAVAGAMNKLPYGVHPCVVDPAVALERLRGLLTRLVGGAIELMVDIRYRELLLPMEEESLERILVNLARNAAQAMPEGGYLRICWRMVLPQDETDGMQELPRLVLSVQDTGCGMSEDRAKLLSGAGRRSQSAMRAGSAAKRHGLGFSIVRELVEQAGGELKICSHPGAGTLVEMTWPLRNVAEHEAGQEKSFRGRRGRERHSGVKMISPSQGPVSADDFPDRRTDQCG